MYKKKKSFTDLGESGSYFMEKMLSVFSFVVLQLFWLNFGQIALLQK